MYCNIILTTENKYITSSHVIKEYINMMMDINLNVQFFDKTFSNDCGKGMFINLLIYKNISISYCNLLSTSFFPHLIFHLSRCNFNIQFNVPFQHFISTSRLNISYAISKMQHLKGNISHSMQHSFLTLI